MHGIRLIRQMYRGADHGAEVAEGNREIHRHISAAALIDAGARLRERLWEVVGGRIDGYPSD